MEAQKLAVGSFRAAGPCQSLESSGTPQSEDCWRRRVLAWGGGGETFLGGNPGSQWKRRK